MAEIRASERRGVRMMAGRGKQTLSKQEMQQKEILRIAREMVKLERERRKLKKRLKEIGKELRLQRRAQRVVLAPSFSASEGLDG